MIRSHSRWAIVEDCAMPQKNPSKQRAPEQDYSHRTLAEKLGIKPDLRIAVLGVEDAEFQRELQAIVPDYSRGDRVSEANLIFFSAEAKEDLSKLKPLARSICKSGGIWVVYPKGQTHIREIDVINAGKSAGLTDNKVVRFSATHTALRFVIPLAKR
jgi:hypothetical protein